MINMGRQLGNSRGGEEGYFKNKSRKCVHKAFGKIGAAAGDISITEYFSRDLNPIWTWLTLFVVPFKDYGAMLWIQI